MNGLRHYLEKFPTLGGFIPAHAQTMILFSDVDGNILWANDAFLGWIGYTMSEFTRQNSPVTWKQITVPDASLDADIEMAEKTSNGNQDSYVIRKFYIPKNQSPQFVELFVRRFPSTGGKAEFELFVCEVSPLFNGHARIAKDYENSQQELVACLTAMNDKLEAIANHGLNAAVTWLMEHKWAGIPTLIFLVYIVFGERTADVLRNIISAGR